MNLRAFVLIGCFASAGAPAAAFEKESWEMGPFIRRKEPVLTPAPDSTFLCPVRKKLVRWEERNVYNPAAVVRDGKVYLFYRADDKSPDLAWGRTCRIGLAWSDDGIHFTRNTKPVMYPDNDKWKQYEWEGGCEDLHIIEGPDGTCYMNYTTWSGRRDTMSIATSKDLFHWEKHGPAFRKNSPENVFGSRSGVVIARRRGNRIVAEKINGRYWMYYTHPCALAWSDDLINWTPAGKAVWSGGHEAGAVALLRDDGILLMFNSSYWNRYGSWTLGQALFDRTDLTTVLKIQKAPFLFPRYDWEKKGFTNNTTVANTLVFFKGKWFLYYGAADHVIGVAVCDDATKAPEVSGEPTWKKHIKPNAAYLRAQKRPPFSMSDPTGLVRLEAEKEKQRNAAEKLRTDLFAACTRGAKSFTIPPGQYRFAGNRGLVFERINDFTINAHGVTFWFERPKELLAADPKGLIIKNCSKVSIKGLRIDFDPPVFLQAEILSINETEPSYTVKIDPGFPDAEMKGGSYFLYRKDGSWIRHGYLFYKESKRIDGRMHKVLLKDRRVFDVHNNKTLLKFTGGSSQIAPGDYIVLPWRRGRGIYMYRCDRCVLEDVDEYASPGMGILEYQGKGGNIYRRVRIIPPPGTRRLHACAADGFHNAQTEKGPHIIECEFTGTSDDFFNLHGHFGVVWHPLDEKTYVIGQANLNNVNPGASLAFYDQVTVEKKGTAAISALAPLKDPELIALCNSRTLPTHANRTYYKITLKKPVALSIGNLVALDGFRSAGFLIEDCYFHDAMARSLINGAGDGTITGNIIERSAWGLVIHFETWRYFEGPMPENIEVTGNVFSGIRDVLLPNHATAVTITMVPKHGGYLRSARPLKNLRIAGNYIERPGGFGILMTNTDGAEITGNTIVRPMYRPHMKGSDRSAIQCNIGHANYFGGKAREAAISLWSCSNVTVKDNRIIDPEKNCTHGALQVGEHCSDIRTKEKEDTKQDSPRP